MKAQTVASNLLEKVDACRRQWAGKKTQFCHGPITIQQI